ncbi:MAG TPA: hypothetical protein VFZ25_12145 [Chloroflexota bacterium]|nr:hypothetical protein [Chloroflexota bacterium]
MNRPLIWQNRAPVPSYLYPPVGVAVNGQLYAIGRYAIDGRFHAAIYGPASDTWTMRPGSIDGQWTNFPQSVAAGTNGKIYVAINSLAGNPDLLEYDPAADTWRTRASAPVVLSAYSWVAGRDGRLYLIGGSDSGGPGTTVEAYDPNADRWTAAAPLPVAVESPSVAATSDGKIYVFGNDLIEIYSPTSNSWTILSATSLVTPMMGAVQASNGKIYLAGGPYNPYTMSVSNAVLVYDPRTNLWEDQTPLSWGKQSPSLVTPNGTDLYLLGGWTGASYDVRMEEATTPQ